MPAGRVWGGAFLSFSELCAMTTLVAVFENIMAFTIDEWGWGQKKGLDCKRNCNVSPLDTVRRLV
jgi:NSS family neurotransmitter:Na+ symporter